MADPDVFSPNHKPPVRQPKSGDPLWNVRVNNVKWSAELRFHGESYGWEAQILRDGDLISACKTEIPKAARPTGVSLSGREPLELW